MLAWEEVADGIAWAGAFLGPSTAADRAPLISTGFLQRFQYYAAESRRYYEDRYIESLRAIPLLHNDWSRNKDRVDPNLRKRLEDEVMPKLARIGPEGERMWRVVDFAARFACYALR